jgi:hypothetical protein
MTIRVGGMRQQPLSVAHIFKCPVCGNGAITKLAEYASCVCGWNSRMTREDVERKFPKVQVKTVAAPLASVQTPGLEVKEKKPFDLRKSEVPILQNGKDVRGSSEVPIYDSPVQPPTAPAAGASADDLGAGEPPPSPVAEVTSSHVAFFRSLSPPSGAIAWADGHPTVEETKAYLQSLAEEDRAEFLKASDAWQELKAS